MGERPRVDDDPIAATASLMDLLDQIALVIALVGRDLDIPAIGLCHRGRDVVGECRRPVDLGFAFAQEIQIRPMQYQDPTGGALTHVVTVAPSAAREALQDRLDDVSIDPGHDLEADGTIEHEGQSRDGLFVARHQLDERDGIQSVGQIRR